MTKMPTLAVVDRLKIVVAEWAPQEPSPSEVRRGMWVRLTEPRSCMEMKDDEMKGINSGAIRRKEENGGR